MVEKVDPLNPELMDEFKTLRRMLRRWADDHATALKAARPAKPPAFIARPADNWILQWAIADTAGAEWGQQARDAAERLSEAGIVEPSWLERLVSEFWILFVEPPDKAAPLERVPSADLVKRLTDDPVSVWWACRANRHCLSPSKSWNPKFAEGMPGAAAGVAAACALAYESATSYPARRRPRASRFWGPNSDL